MATVINTTFKLKRGTEARWAEVNPVLALGEPGFVYDTNRLKIGDGVTAWNDLPYIDGKREVAVYNSSTDFPSVGEQGILYNATSELSLYQFNSSTNTYEKLSDGRGIDDITIINGGNA